MQVPAESVSTSGSPAKRDRVADSGNVITTWFCEDCGSALYTKNSARPRVTTIYVGALDDAESVEVSAHIWVNRKLPWVVLPRGHRVFQMGGDWSSD